MSNILGAFRLTKGNFTLDVEFDFPSSGITAITGASGCGKTTLLRCIAGLENAVIGDFHINGECWLDSQKNIFTPPNKRIVGYIFQDAALFPHMSVKQNLEYAYKRRNVDQHTIAWDDVIDSTGISKLVERNIGNLSGGEKQRVAIARALLSNPDILLMDEPVSSLDKKSRASITKLIGKIHNEHNIPIIYVSHDLEEISQLADRVMCIENGKVTDIGKVNDILSSFDKSFSHEETAHTIIQGEVVDYDRNYHLAKISFAGGSLFISSPSIKRNSNVKLQIYARDVSISIKKPTGTSILNIVQASIIEVCPKKDSHGQYIIKLDANDAILLAHITQRSLEDLKLEVGLGVYAQIKSVSVRR